MTVFIYVVAACVGLIVGSFLNVVIARLPVMLMRSFRADATEYLGMPPEAAPQSPLNLCFPRSFCPHCRHQIPAYDNIPLLSFLFLRGRCRFCRTAISWQYPLIELLSAVLTVLAFYGWGWSWAAVFYVFFSWLLLVATGIDWHTQLLPDEVTWPLIALGLLAACWHVFVSPGEAIVGLLTGYYILWVLYWLFWLFTKKEGLGFGDFKLLAGIGAMGGVYVVFVTLLIAAVAGLLFALSQALWQYRQQGQMPTLIGQKMPFGPFLALGGWCACYVAHVAPMWLSL